MATNPLTWLTDFLPSVVGAGIGGIIVALLGIWMGYRQGFKNGEYVGKLRLMRRIFPLIKLNPRDSVRLGMELLALADEVQKEKP